MLSIAVIVNRIGRASACERLMGRIFWGGGSTPDDFRSKQKGGSGVHHGRRFQLLEEGEQRMMRDLGSLQGFRIFNYF